MFNVVLHPLAEKDLDQLDNSIRIQILKKIAQLQREDLESRHLKHGSPYFVEEAGQYRICFKKDDAAKTKTIYFVGSHKEYEKWYKSYK